MIQGAIATFNKYYAFFGTRRELRQAFRCKLPAGRPAEARTGRNPHPEADRGSAQLERNHCFFEKAKRLEGDIG